MEAATTCLDGEAWELFQWLDRRQPMQTWGELKEVMTDKFFTVHGRELTRHTFTSKIPNKLAKAGMDMKGSKEVSYGGITMGTCQNTEKKKVVVTSSGLTITSETPL